jgi:hypothetical protein
VSQIVADELKLLPSSARADPEKVQENLEKRLTERANDFYPAMHMATEASHYFNLYQDEGRLVVKCYDVEERRDCVFIGRPRAVYVGKPQKGDELSGVPTL